MPVEEKTVNIIIIGYNLPKLESQCIEAVCKNTNWPYLLTFFDNFNSGLTLTHIWNVLIESSPCKYICLLNNDTEVSPNWLTLMCDTLGNKYADHTKTRRIIGFVGPSTNQCHSPQKNVASLEEAQKHAGKVLIMTEPISGFCMLFHKKTWCRLGGFDERYCLYGQESDLIDRALKQLDLYCAWRMDAFVFHHGEASVRAAKINVELERSRARALYWESR